MMDRNSCGSICARAGSRSPSSVAIGTGIEVRFSSMTVPSVRNGGESVSGWKSRNCSPAGDRLDTRTSPSAGIFTPASIVATTRTPSSSMRTSSTRPTWTPRSVTS